MNRKERIRNTKKNELRKEKVKSDKQRGGGGGGGRRRGGRGGKEKLMEKG